MPRERRNAMHAIYAFARVIDDIADGDEEAAVMTAAGRRRLMDAWRGEIGALYAGAPVSLIGRALARPVARFDLPREEFIALIDGMEMDLNGPIIAPPMNMLRLYTRRVAGAVGLLSMRAFEAWRGEASERFALHLGDAFQLTNILRDVEEDAGLGRLYLPQELLEKHGLPQTGLKALLDADLAPICADLGALAQAEFNAARREIKAHRRSRLAPALMMMGVYEGYLEQMRAQGWRRDGGVRLSTMAKIGRGLRYVIATPSPSV